MTGRHTDDQTPPRRQQMNKKQRAELAARHAGEYQAGATVKQIADRHDVAYSALRRALGEAGLLRGMGPPPRREVDEQLAEKLVNEYVAGHSLRDVAQRHDLTFAAVYRVVGEAGALRPPGHHNQRGR